jgi:hypothetical protein
MKNTLQGMKSKGNPDQAGMTAKICSLCLHAHLIPHSNFSHAFLYYIFLQNPKVKLINDA